MTTLLDRDAIEAFPVDEFLAREPFPWLGASGILTPAGFEALRADFPPLSLFAWHDGLARHHGQRPHNRWYLACEASPYEVYEGGVEPRAALPAVWRQLLDELETDPSYRDLVATCLGRTDLSMRYVWHVGVTGSEVSPHVDDPRKAGTHIFYFNTADDWHSDWGGRTVVLCGKTTPAMNPDFSDFASAIPVETVGNHSFFFRNTPRAWHGVEPLSSPQGSQRRLFNVVFEHPGADQPPRATLTERIKRRARALVSD